MNDLDLLNALRRRLNDVYAREGMTGLPDIDGVHPFTVYHEVTDRHEKRRPLSFHLHDDLAHFGGDLMHFTGLMYVLRPFINDPVREDGTYFREWYDLRYHSYASAARVAAYNFWDRIGDLLDAYFETGLPAGSVYVGRVLNNFPKAYGGSENFERLRQIFEEDVRPLIDERNNDAHVLASPTEEFYRVILAKPHERADHVLRRRALPDFFKRQLKLAHEAAELTLRLINELPLKGQITGP